MQNHTNAAISVIKEIKFFTEEGAEELCKELKDKIIDSDEKDNQKTIHAAFEAVRERLGHDFVLEPWKAEIEGLEHRIKVLEALVSKFAEKELAALHKPAKTKKDLTAKSS